MSGKELRQSEDRRKKAAYAEELQRQMQEMAANKQRSAFDTIISIFVESKYCTCAHSLTCCFIYGEITALVFVCVKYFTRQCLL